MDSTGLNNPCFDLVKSIHEFKVYNLKKEVVKLDTYANHVCIIVNSATKSALTELHYEQFNALINKHGEKGLRVLAFPCNQFDNCEPGTSEEIAEHAEKHNVKFDIFGKVEVNGIDAIPLYKYIKKILHNHKKGDVIKSNYTKFIINKAGLPSERFGPEVLPTAMESAIEMYL